MALMYDKVVEKCGDVLVPLMITCDPARDTPEVLKEYLKEFHPQIIGLTGDYDAIKDMCKAYRVYFSTPPHVKPGQDYLVDHSIYFYLMGKLIATPILISPCISKHLECHRAVRAPYRDSNFFRARNAAKIRIG